MPKKYYFDESYRVLDVSKDFENPWILKKYIK